MKILIIIMLFLFASVVRGKTETDKMGKFSANENDSAILTGLENDWVKALIQRDRNFMERCLADGFIYTENEKTYSRSELIEALVAGADIIEAAYNSDMEVHIFGSTGVVTGWLVVMGKNAEGQFRRQYRFTDTWLKSNGKWQLVAAQDYLMP